MLVADDAVRQAQGGKVLSGQTCCLMEPAMNLYGDWPLPQPKTSTKTGREGRTPAASNTEFVPGIFSCLVAPVMAEAAKRSQELG